MPRHDDSTERWAAAVIGRELSLKVEIHDDSSAPAMYDLRVGPAQAPEYAIEVVGARDRTTTETWQVGPARGPRHLRLAGDWYIEVHAAARMKELWAGLEVPLVELEAAGINEVDLDPAWGRPGHPAASILRGLGVAHAGCYNPHGSGVVHLSMPGMGAIVTSQGLAGWLAEFLTSAATADVRRKLGSSGAPNRHAFVHTDLTLPPSHVVAYLTGGIHELPTEPVRLPTEVTAVWVCAQPAAGDGLFWDGSAWRRVVISDG